jgi:protein-S-isoprenylcysteine O-methyltransferase Ste14
MSLVPVFEIGLWNAWIFVLYEVLTFPFFLRMARNRAPESGEKSARMSKNEKIALYSSKIVMFAAFVYAIFLPLKLGTIWFYVGLPVTLAGLVLGTVILFDWAKTPPDRPVTRGLYRYSRHPMYIGLFLLLLGVSIATASWVFLVLAIAVTVVSFAFAYIEEQACLERYGEAYREYMNRTPRFFGTAKS